MSRAKRGIPCQTIQGLLSEYIDNQLNKTEKGVVEAHLEVCDACSKQLESLLTTVQLLRNVPQAPVPRSFRVSVAKRERAFLPVGFHLPNPVNAAGALAFNLTSLRWLRTATVVAAIALVALLVGDSLNLFENGSSGDKITLTYIEEVSPTVATEKQIMVKVPGVLGQMSLAAAKSVGYINYDVLPPTPVPAPPAREVILIRDDTSQSGIGIVGEHATGVSWPLRQIEIALGALVFIFIVLMVLFRRRGREPARN